MFDASLRTPRRWWWIVRPKTNKHFQLNFLLFSSVEFLCFFLNHNLFEIKSSILPSTKLAIRAPHEYNWLPLIYCVSSIHLAWQAFCRVVCRHRRVERRIINYRGCLTRHSNEAQWKNLSLHNPMMQMHRRSKGHINTPSISEPANNSHQTRAGFIYSICDVIIIFEWIALRCWVHCALW